MTLAPTGPGLGYMDVRGSTGNNRIGASGSWPANALENVIYDPADADAARRYKGFIGAEGRQPNISADGLDSFGTDIPPLDVEGGR